MELPLPEKTLRLTSDEARKRLDQALRLLGDEARNNRRTAQGIIIVLGHVARLKEARTSGRYGTSTERHKKAARQVAAALRKLQRSLKDCADDLRVDFTFDKYDFEKWITRADEAGIARVPKQNPKDQAKLYAAEAALRLLQKHNLSAPITRKGKWCGLAAILYGEPGVDFRHHCRKVKASTASPI